MTAAANRRNRRATARSRRRAKSPWIPATARNLRVSQDAAGLTTSTYDGDNLRRKIVSGSVTTTFVWDPSSLGTGSADYLQIKPSSGDATLLIALEGEVVGHVKGSEKRDTIVDPLGSVVAYLNSSQTLTDQFEYWPYGELVAEFEEGTEPFLWVGSLGYFRDSDLRTYIRAREYRQDLGSWMQLDPLWPLRSAYLYGDLSPVDTSDPSGLFPWVWIPPRRRWIAAKARFIVEIDLETYVTANDVSWNPKKPTRRYTDCGVFVRTCARVVDPNYPFSGTSNQKTYVEDPEKGGKIWEVLPITKDIELLPGDILWRKGHTEVFVGQGVRKIFNKKARKYEEHVCPESRYGASLGGHKPMWKGTNTGSFTHIFRLRAVREAN